MLTLLLCVLVICVQGGKVGGGKGRGGGYGRGGGGFRSSSRSGGRNGRSSYSGYKAKKSRGSTLKKAAAIGATAFVGYQVNINQSNGKCKAGCLGGSGIRMPGVSHVHT